MKFAPIDRATFEEACTTGIAKDSSCRMTIRVAKPGFFTTVQDLGRYGYAHLGISPAGAADALSFRIANLLVGNDENAPALEMTLLGATSGIRRERDHCHYRRRLRMQSRS